MTGERWRIFPVADYQRLRAFVAEVLLYDRLFVPVPSDAEERVRWSEIGREPDRLDRDLESLGDLAIRVPWDQPKRDAFKSRFAAVKAVALTRLVWRRPGRRIKTRDAVVNLWAALVFLPSTASEKNRYGETAVAFAAATSRASLTDAKSTIDP